MEDETIISQKEVRVKKVSATGYFQDCTTTNEGLRL